MKYIKINFTIYIIYININKINFYIKLFNQYSCFIIKIWFITTDLNYCLKKQNTNNFIVCWLLLSLKLSSISIN